MHLAQGKWYIIRAASDIITGSMTPPTCLDLLESQYLTSIRSEQAKVNTNCSVLYNVQSKSILVCRLKVRFVNESCQCRYAGKCIVSNIKATEDAFGGENQERGWMW